MLETGTKAPDFALPDKDGKEVTLAQFAGKKLVLYFYSKDSTAGCTRQALAFAAACDEIKQLGAEVIGISKDSAASHARFAEKNSLPFTLLSDTELTAIKAYDVWHEKKSSGKVTMGVVRTAYVIDEQGIIIDAIGKVNTKAHTAQLLK